MFGNSSKSVLMAADTFKYLLKSGSSIKQSTRRAPRGRQQLLLWWGTQEIQQTGSNLIHLQLHLGVGKKSARHFTATLRFSAVFLRVFL